jgi:hypothetical protein
MPIIGITPILSLLIVRLLRIADPNRAFVAELQVAMQVPLAAWR